MPSDSDSSDSGMDDMPCRGSAPKGAPVRRGVAKRASKTQQKHERKYFDSGDWAKHRNDHEETDAVEVPLEHKYPTLANGGAVLFRDLTAEQKKEIFDKMFEVRLPPETVIFNQGDLGDNFYVIGEGKCAIFVRGADGVEKLEVVVGPGDSFGELALLYNAPRAATVKTLTECTLYGMDRATFRQRIADGILRKRETYKAVLESIPLLQKLDSYPRLQLADAVTTQAYHDHELVVRDGEPGECFYIILEGHAVAKKAGKEIRHYGPGDFFGELALLTKMPRACDVEAEGRLLCMVLDEKRFEQLRHYCEQDFSEKIAAYDRMSGVSYRPHPRQGDHELQSNVWPLENGSNMNMEESSPLVRGAAPLGMGDSDDDVCSTDDARDAEMD